MTSLMNVLYTYKVVVELANADHGFDPDNLFLLVQRNYVAKINFYLKTKFKNFIWESVTCISEQDLKRVIQIK